MQAVDSMLLNAVAHGAGTITLHGRDGEIHVLDEGPGFADLGRAFERFSHDGVAGAGLGLGLGLAIVEAIAVAHGGTAGEGDRESGGADVWIALPRHRTH